MFFSFIARKRTRSARKQQQQQEHNQEEIVASESIVSNNHPVTENERLADDNDERHSSISHTTAAELHEPLPIKYSHNPIHDFPSVPYFSQYDTNRNLNNPIDAYSFADIEVGSITNDEKIEGKFINQSSTPKSLASRNISLATNLSTYSTQSLLRKLLNKAQVLDEYYNDIVNKTQNQTSLSLSSSLSSLLGRSGATPRPFIYRIRSNDSFKKVPSRKKYRQVYDRKSSDSSRFDLYTDEDNVLRELIRFNNDIDLILTRLEMEGENVQQHQVATINPQQSDENPIQQTTINPTDDTIPNVSPQINDQ